MGRKKDTRLFEELVFCKGCKHITSNLCRCQHPDVVERESFPYEAIFIHPYIDYINKNNDCLLFEKKEIVVVDESIFETIVNKFRNILIRKMFKDSEYLK
jgi:hypothetical protein